MKRILFFCIVAALSGVQAVAQSGQMKTEIMTANQKYMAIFSKGTVGINALYAQDAELLPPNSEVVKGNPAIGPLWEGAFDAGIKNVSLETISAEAAGDKNIETSRYKLSGANSTQIDMGKYLVV